jgi:hypothetical protein
VVHGGPAKEGWYQAHRSSSIGRSDDEGLRLRGRRCRGTRSEPHRREGGGEAAGRRDGAVVSDWAGRQAKAEGVGRPAGLEKKRKQKSIKN